MCDCKNVEMGSYDNQTTLQAPKWSSHKLICVDTCLLDEILYLWMVHGIRTTGCCCGHNKKDGYIGVWFENIPAMKKLGYEVAPNTCKPGDEDGFYPKSTKRISNKEAT